MNWLLRTIAVCSAIVALYFFIASLGCWLRIGPNGSPGDAPVTMQCVVAVGLAAGGWVAFTIVSCTQAVLEQKRPG